MQAALLIALIIALIELATYLPAPWRARRMFSVALMAAVFASTLLLLAKMPAAGGIVAAYFSVYRLINLARVFAGRIQIKYLYRSALKASVWLILLQAATVVLSYFTGRLSDESIAYATVLAALQLAAIVGLLFTAFRSLRKISSYAEASQPAGSLPTLSVLIPARNETTALENCLHSLVNSTYPKLEVIVLDDSSQDKRTPEIIRSFAQRGVRFIPGDAPPESWLAKNYAYKELTGAANGELLLLCGVDTEFTPNALGNMVRLLLARQDDMVCFLPKNNLPANAWSAALIQPLRYAWELALPRLLKRRPPVLSTCWIIKREVLLAGGGFDAVSRKIIPESYFARHAASRNSYDFASDQGVIGLTSTKAFTDQRDTSVRTRYPQLHRRVELTALLSLAEAWLFVSPPILLVAGLISHAWALMAFSLAGLGGVCALSYMMSMLAYRKRLASSVWLAVPAAIYDIFLLNFSMWKYEFSQVIWKGRDVRGSVMGSTPFKASTSG